MTTTLIAMTTMVLAGVATGQVRPASDFGTFVWQRCEPILTSSATIGGVQASDTPFARPRIVGTYFELEFDARADQVSPLTGGFGAASDVRASVSADLSDPAVNAIVGYWQYDAYLINSQLRGESDAVSGEASSRAYFRDCGRRGTGLRLAGATRYVLLLDGYVVADDPNRFQGDQASTYVEAAFRPSDRDPTIRPRVELAELLERGAAFESGAPLEPIVLSTGWIFHPPSGRTMTTMLGFEASLRTPPAAVEDGPPATDLAYMDARVRLELISMRFGCSLADWDANDIIDVADFSAYLNDWSAAEPDADLTTSGAADFTAIDGDVDMSDFAYFLALWAEGCP